MKKILQLSLVLVVQISFAQGYNFLGSYTSNGTPLYLEPVNDVISTETMQMIQNTVPEGYPVPDYNPHYISSGYDTDITLDQATDVWVTFVKEGAGYKNVLGFYTYDINNPPTTTPTPSEITIIFPNASEGGYGGGLIKGNKVKIGTFPAGTGIGWVLLADGWDDTTTSVTAGVWQLYSNPDFNPEADPNLRYHNILISDKENERIILGFEDIRRDYNSCDNDFNDALFYVTANPYTALRTTNYPDVESATDVSSGNLGGLESNGNLAELIAKRNFNRLKNNTFAHKKSLQPKYEKRTLLGRNANVPEIDLSDMFPSSGMFGTEQSYDSTPLDLLAITNAIEVFSVDYYDGNNRVAAALATKTLGSVYNHSKMICDRLNGSILKDIRTVKIQDHELVMIKVERANAQIEYAILFSVAEENANYQLHSYWNIFQYPLVDYTNFQIWGATMGQVSHITNHVLTEINSIKTLNSSEALDRIPSVFIKKGSYQNGLITLEIVNKSGDNNLQISANKRETELASETSILQSIPLSGDYEEEITLNTGSLFDIGLTLLGNSSPQADAIYLADGPWGLDINETETTISNFEIETSTISNTDDYLVERNPSVSGTVLGTANLFRTILPGELTFDASAYQAIQFSVKNNLPIEIILVTENLTDWNNRFTYHLPANTQLTAYNIPFSSFANTAGETLPVENLKSIVFSVQGNYQSFQDFNLNVQNVVFTTENLGTETYEILTNKTLINYPNPVQNETTLLFPTAVTSATISIYDMLGRNVYESEEKIIDRKTTLQLAHIKPGVYQCIVKVENQKEMQLRFIVE